jgi:hypothetical protein
MKGRIPRRGDLRISQSVRPQAQLCAVARGFEHNSRLIDSFEIMSFATDSTIPA